MALTGSPLVAFIATTEIAEAKAFYGELLGLELVDETPFALVFDVAGTILRITPVAEVRPAPYTVLGWTVDDITSAVADLKARGTSAHTNRALSARSWSDRAVSMPLREKSRPDDVGTGASPRERVEPEMALRVHQPQTPRRHPVRRDLTGADACLSLNLPSTS